MKKALIIFLIAAFLAPCAMAFEMPKFFKKKECIKKCIVQNAQKEDKIQIRQLLEQMNLDSNAHNAKKIMSYYDKDFKSADGFNYQAFEVMIKETFDSYKDIKYQTVIKNIDVIGDWATAEVEDKTTATLEGKTSQGVLNGLCNYVIYFKRTENGWKIISDSIITEETSLKYGEAQNVKMELLTPLLVEKGSQYTVSLKMERPKESLVLASLGREDIIYPPNEPQEKYRKLPKDGLLERIVKANSKGLNEYAIATVGFTRLSLGEDKSALKFAMSGMAFLMRRVNVYPEKNAYIQPKKDGETPKK